MIIRYLASLSFQAPHIKEITFKKSATEDK